MASRGKGARIKGAQFERDIANILTEQTGYIFQRSLSQSRGGGAEEADVFCPDLKDVHFELKRQQRCNIKGAYLQALEDSGKNKTCIIITKDDREDILVTMEFSQWLPLFLQWLQTKK